MNSGSPILISSLLTATLIFSLGCNNKKDEKLKTGGRPKNMAAEAYVLQAETFRDAYIASGTLLPNEEINILPEISGRVTGIFFTEGAKVRKGQKLVQLYSADISAQIQKLRTQKDLQLKIKDRQEDLVKIGGISRQDFETTLTQIQSIDADIAYQEAQLRKTSIIAPFDGVVGIRSISIGAVIDPSTVITKLQQINPLRIDFMVPDRYRQSLHNGKEVFFSVSGSIDTLTGSVKAIEPAADINTRNIRVQAQIPNANNTLTAGSFAHVIVPFSSDNNALLIPSQAIIPTTKEKKAAVLRNGKAEIVTITLGSRTTDKVQVLQGLAAGDTILVTGIMQVRPGMEVKITKLIR